MYKKLIPTVVMIGALYLPHYTSSMMKHFAGFNAHSSRFICTNKHLLKDRKDFLDQMADFTYPTPLYVIPSDHAQLGSKSIQTLQYQDDMDIFGDSDAVTEMADNYIPQDRIDKTFVLKRCVNRYGRSLPEKAIREAVGSYIGSSLGISVNKIKIIPTSMPFAGKEFYQSPFTATLHTYMPGKEIALLQFNIDLREPFATEQCFESATWHQDLCDISILDICADNDDRHKYNYRFDEKNNRFHAYDMDESFNIPQTMADRSLRFLQDFLHKKNINVQEKNTLIRLKNSLKHFLFNFPQGSLYNIWMQKAREAEYIYSEIEKKNIEKKLDTHRIDVQKLHSFLENFINTTRTQKIDYKIEDLF